MTAFDTLMSVAGPMRKLAEDGGFLDTVTNAVSGLFGGKEQPKGIPGYMDLPHTGQITSNIMSNVNKDDLANFNPDSVGRNLPKVNVNGEDSASYLLARNLKNAVEDPTPNPSMVLDALEWLGSNREDFLGTGLNIPNWVLLAGILGAGGLSAWGLSSLASNDDQQQQEDATNAQLQQQLKTAAVLQHIQKQALARAMKAQDPTEGPQIPQRPTLNQKSSLQRLLEITRTRGLQNQDFGQHGMSSVKSAGKVELAKDPDEKGNVEKRPTLTPGSSLQKLLQIVQSNKLKKSAANNVLAQGEGQELPTENNIDPASYAATPDAPGFFNNAQLQAIQRLAFGHGIGPRELYQSINQLTGQAAPIAEANGAVRMDPRQYDKTYGASNPFSNAARMQARQQAAAAKQQTPSAAQQPSNEAK